ncbi:MAG: hypothetical protein IJP11_04015 [Oscillospiraceae bacterium]|nr:hypothetical protein [Oscillospiraceae bacterium]
MKYPLWVDLQNKQLSLEEQDGFTRYVYDTEACLQKVLKLLAADGFRMYRLAV